MLKIKLGDYMDLTKREKIGLSAFIIIILVITSGMYYYKNRTNAVEVISKDNKSVSNSDNKNESSNDKNSIMVDICGEIKNPGLYTLNDGDRVAKLVKAAGGFTKNADIVNVNLAMKLKDEDFIRIPSKLQNNTAFSQGEPAIRSSSQASGASPLININTGTKEQLMELPRIGVALAQRIIDYRENTGLFKDIKDITNVSGIGPKMFDNIKDKITVH